MRPAQIRYRCLCWRAWQRPPKYASTRIFGATTMPTVEIYTSPFCGFCHAAKRLLSQKGVTFAEFDVSRDPGLRQKMMERAHGRYTVPQIFVGETHVGGCDDLYAMDRAGKLDPLLAG